MSDNAGEYTWEGIIAAVTMAGRPDRLHDLQMAWHHHFQILDTGSQTLRDLKAKLAERDWSGSGADAYRHHYDALVAAIDDFYTSMSKLVAISGDTADALTLAISQIPLPDMADPDNLGMHTIQASDAAHGNQVQYNFFRTHQDRYRDGGFLYHALAKGNDQTFSFTTPKQRAEQVQRWYDEGTRRARAAFTTLLAAYDEQHTAIPTTRPALDDAPRTQYDDGQGGAGSGTGTSAAGAGPGAGGTFSGGAGYGGATPTAQSGSAQGPTGHNVDASTWNRGLGTQLSGTGTSSGAGPGANVGGTLGAPGVGGGGGSGAGAGGFGGAGFTPGYGAASVAYGAVEEPTPPSRGTGLRAGAAEPAEGRSGNMYGASPGSSAGRGGRDEQEHQTWLHEDRDIWSTPLGPPSVIE